MKKSTGSVLTVVFAVLVFCFSFSGCVGKNYVKPPITVDNIDIVQFGRTGFLGNDHSGTAFILKAQNLPEKPLKVKLEKYYHRTFDSWEQKCPSPKQRKNFKHEEVTENSSEEVINPDHVSQYSGAPIVFGGSNPSFINAVAPAAAIAGGMIVGAAVLRPDRIMGAGKGSGGGGCDKNGCY